MTNKPQTLRDDLSYFLYRSTAREGLGRDDIESIVIKARVKNSKLGLTGCLHHEDGLFFQWLEGPGKIVDMMHEQIRQDPRHTDMADLSRGFLPQRRFAEWTMRSSDRRRASLLDWFATERVSTIDRGAYAGSVSAFLMMLDN